MAKIGMIGAGSWGTALAVVLNKNGHEVTVWSVIESEILMLQEHQEHIDKLPAFLLRLRDAGEPEEKLICDYIGSMTDRYAIAKYQEIYIPKTWHG